jgi:hypothetical protein
VVVKVHDVGTSGPLLTRGRISEEVIIKDNYVRIVRSRRYFRSNSCEWWEKISDGEIGHEVGHLLGLRDRYIEETGEPSEEKWRGTIMHDSKGFATPEQIEAMVRSAQAHYGYLLSYDGNVPK